MNFLLLYPFQQHEKVPPVSSDGIPGQKYGEFRLGGGIFGGGIDVLKQYNELWDSTLQRYFAANRFAGQDQCVMGTIYLEHPELFNIFNPIKGYSTNAWFDLLLLWS